MFVYFAEVDTSNVVQRVVITDSKYMIDEEDDTVSEELGKKYCTRQFGDISPNTWVRTYKKGSPPNNSNLCICSELSTISLYSSLFIFQFL